MLSSEAKRTALNIITLVYSKVPNTHLDVDGYHLVQRCTAATEVPVCQSFQILEYQVSGLLMLAG